MRVLVSGGAGFIGSHLVDALLDRGEDVVALDDLSSGRRENLAPAIERGARLVECDVADAGSVSRAFSEHPPELVFHLAAQIDVRHSVADPAHDLSVNVGGTINMLEAAKKAGSSRFVLASTGGAIYGEGAGRQLPMDESAECLPDAPYGQSKLAAEGYLALYGRLYGVAATALRLGNVFGPRQDPHGEAGVVAIFSGILLQGRAPRVFGDGLQVRDYIYVDDVVAAFLAAAEAPPGGPYNVGTGIGTNVLELGAAIAALCDRPFEPQMAPERPGEVQAIYLDSSRARSELGWEAAASLEEGLRRTVEWFRG